MKRLFVFGCSYTSYSWPTYATFLNIDYPIFENWGLSGVGNRAIAERVAECHLRNNFTKDDVIIVQWSTHLRNDWWHQESMPERTVGWKTYGSIFNYHNKKLYDDKWIKTFFFEPAYLMHTFNNIALTQQFLNGLGVTWYMTSIGDVRNMGSDLRSENAYGEKTDLIENVPTDEKTAWKVIPDLKIYDKLWTDHADRWLMPFEEFCQSTADLTLKFADGKGKWFADLHPSPMQALLWVEQELKDKLMLSNNISTIGREVVDEVDKIYQKMKFDKQAFEFSLGLRNGFPPSAKMIDWPGRPYGF